MVKFKNVARGGEEVLDGFAPFDDNDILGVG